MGSPLFWWLHHKQRNRDGGFGRPETERQSHYFHAILPQQFDAVLHFDQSRAVEPLEPSNEWHRGEETPETFPFGL